MKIDGACHCGYIRVEGDADPEKRRKQENTLHLGG